jgi:homoserine dehydrogenase
MVVIEGDAVRRIVLSGPGAGEGPTASAVMGDVMDLARGIRLPVFGQPATSLVPAASAVAAAAAPFYLRMRLQDKPGALAKIAAVLGDEGISIDRMRQREHTEPTATVLIVTHKATRSAIDAAIVGMRGTGVLVGDPVAIRIEDV